MIKIQINSLCTLINYKEVFNDLSTKMTMKCLKFLIDTTSGGGDVCALIKETAENFPAADLNILRELIDVGGAVLQLPGMLEEKYYCTLN